MTVTHQWAQDGRREVISGKTLRATIWETQVSPACSAAYWTGQACWGPVTTATRPPLRRIAVIHRKENSS
jgi:hypothetical protein